MAETSMRICQVCGREFEAEIISVREKCFDHEECGKRFEHGERSRLTAYRGSCSGM